MVAWLDLSKTEEVLTGTIEEIFYKSCQNYGTRKIIHKLENKD
ncbi:hypothetical protein [Neobacillus rhizosphaerae]|nr:hypothetical protein [Neobacillus rhizosphaerae]